MIRTRLKFRRIMKALAAAAEHDADDDRVDVHRRDQGDHDGGDEPEPEELPPRTGALVVGEPDGQRRLLRGLDRSADADESPDLPPLLGVGVAFQVSMNAACSHSGSMP